MYINESSNCLSLIGQIAKKHMLVLGSRGSQQTHFLVTATLFGLTKPICTTTVLCLPDSILFVFCERQLPKVKTSGVNLIKLLGAYLGA